MFEQDVTRSRWGWMLSVGVSITLHAAVLFVLLLRPEPIFISPNYVASGNSDKSYYVVNVSSTGTDAAENEREPMSYRTGYPEKASRPSKQRNRRETEIHVAQGEASDHFARAGTRYGSLMSGEPTGHDVRPALPVVFPDPPITPSELPEGLEGDVIVEVTIDARGEIVGMKLLQGVGNGIDDKVLATLWHWRYTPATMDGIPIMSKHDVRFHLPG